MTKYRKIDRLFIGCLAVVFWSVSVSSVMAFFNDSEPSEENRWQGAVVSLALDAPAPLTVPDGFTVGKHAQSLDLYYQLVVVTDSIDTCEGVTLELKGPTGTTTATVTEFPAVPATELGQWALSATHAAEASELECQFTLQVKAWAKETPEVGFSDTKDILVVVPGRLVSMFNIEPLTIGGEKQITAESQIAPLTGPSGGPIAEENEDDVSEKVTEPSEEPLLEEGRTDEGLSEVAEEDVEGEETDANGEGGEQTDEESDELVEAGEENKEEPPTEETDDSGLGEESVPVNRPEEESIETEPKEEAPDTLPSDVDSEPETPDPDTPDAKPEDEPEVTETETDI